MNYCTRCGAPLTPDTKFCTRCGQPVQAAPPAAPVPPVRPAAPAAAAAAVPQPALDGLWAGSAPGEMVLRSWTVPNVTPQAATGKRSVSKKQSSPKQQQAAPAKQEKPAKKKRRGRFILYLILFLVACYFIGKYNLLG